MPQVSVRYQMYVPAAHHRQPRNSGAVLNLAEPSGGNVASGAAYTPGYFPTLPYTLDGASGLAKLIFWSVTDGSQGAVRPPEPIEETVGSSALDITGWYYPDGGGGDGEAVLLDDAFSARLGRFIDDDFVDVTSNPALTEGANVAGAVPTGSAGVTLRAYTSVASTTEPFRRWILNGDFRTDGQRNLSVAQGTTGLAIALYESNDSTPGQLDLGDWAVGGTIVGGVAVDGGGLLIVGGKPVPVDPWGPLVVRLVRGAVVAARTAGLDRTFAKAVSRAAAQDALAAIKSAEAKLKKLAR